MKTGRGGRQCSCLSPILFVLNGKCHTKEALEGFGDVKRGQVICTVKYRDGHLLPAKEQTVTGHVWQTDWNWKMLWNANEYGKK